jgi:hypothetical protein
MANNTAQNIPLAQQPIYESLRIDPQFGTVLGGVMNPMWLYFFNEQWANTTGIAFTANGLVYVNSAGKLTSTPAATNGQLLIGRTGNPPNLTTLTAGPGITISNGPGTIEISGTGIGTFSAGTTGFQPAIASSGNIVLSGTLNVGHGGTGQNTFGLGQIIYGSGAGVPLGTDTNFTWAEGTGLTVQGTGNIVHTTEVKSPSDLTLQSGGISNSGSSMYLNATSGLTGSNPTPVSTLGASDFTIEGYVYFTSMPGNVQIVGCWSLGSSGVGGGRVWAMVLSSGGISLQYAGAGGNSAGFTFANNRWYYLTITISSGTCYLFVDGVLLGTSAIGSTNLSTNAPLVMGYNGDAVGGPVWFLDGYLKDIRISNIARYTSTFTPPNTELTIDANTLVLMNFNGTNGSTTFTDSAGNYFPSNFDTPIISTAQSPYPAAAGDLLFVTNNNTQLTIDSNGKATFEHDVSVLNLGNIILDSATSHLPATAGGGVVWGQTGIRRPNVYGYYDSITPLNSTLGVQIGGQTIESLQVFDQGIKVGGTQSGPLDTQATIGFDGSANFHITGFGGNNFTLATGGNTNINLGDASGIGFTTGGFDRLLIEPSGEWALGGTNPGTSGQVLTSQGSGSPPIWSTASGGITVTDTGTTAGPYNIPFTTADSGTITGLDVSNGLLTFNPPLSLKGGPTTTLGILSVGGPAQLADNGIIANFTGNDNYATYIAISNPNAGTNAETGIVFENDTSNNTPFPNYGYFYYNSSTQVPVPGVTDGAFGMPNAMAWGNVGGDTIIGASGGKIHFITETYPNDAFQIGYQGEWMIGGAASTSPPYSLDGNPGTAGQVFTSQGSGSPPTWSPVISKQMITTTGTDTISNNSSPEIYVVLLGAQATESLTFPSAHFDGQVLVINAADAQTALTMVPQGPDLIKNPLTTIGAGQTVQFIWDTGTGTWY